MTQPDLLAQIQQNVLGKLNPQEQADFKVALPAMIDTRQQAEAGMDMRTQLFDALSKQGDLLSDRKAKLIESMANDYPMSKSETAAMMFIGLLPTLVGGLVKGKKGLAKGAEAGALGTQLMAKGMEAESGRKRTLAASQLESVEDRISDVAKRQQEVQLGGIEAKEKSALQNQQNATTLAAAGIRAGGDKAVAAGLEELGAKLKTGLQTFSLEKASQESAASKQPFKVGNTVYTNKGGVSQKEADAVNKAATSYTQIIESLDAALEKSKSMQTGAVGRMVGKESDALYKEYSIAKNALAELKKVPGLKGADSFTALEGLLESPTSWANNITGALAGTASINEQLENTKNAIERDYNRVLKMNNYVPIPIGSVVNDKKGNKIRITGVAPGGGLTFEPVQ